jgi:hypothetical protein
MDRIMIKANIPIFRSITFASPGLLLGWLLGGAPRYPGLNPIALIGFCILS